MKNFEPLSRHSCNVLATIALGGLFAAFVNLTFVLVSHAAQINKAVISLPAYNINGCVSTRSVADTMLNTLGTGSESIASKIQKAGGEWRLFETPLAADLVILLPTEASESTLLLENLIDALKLRLIGENRRTFNASAGLEGCLLGITIGEYFKNDAVPSLWLDDGWPPYLEALLQSNFKAICEIYESRFKNASTASCTVFSIADPTVVRILKWEPSSLSTHFTAQYICEAFKCLSDVASKTIFCGVFDFPTCTNLVISVSAPFHELAMQERILDSFIEKWTINQPSINWDTFASTAIHLLQLEQRDLVKSALLEATFNKNKWSESILTSLNWTTPTASASHVIFPENSWNTWLQGFKGNRPLLLASTSSYGCKPLTNTVDVAVLTSMETLQSVNTEEAIKKALIESGFYAAQIVKCSPAELCVVVPLALENFTESLKTIEAQLPFKSMAVVTTNIPTYKIAGLINGFVPLSAQDADLQTPNLAPEVLKRLLNAESTNKLELEGRWTLCSTSPSRLAVFLARLAAIGIRLKSMKDIDNLISSL